MFINNILIFFNLLFEFKIIQTKILQKGKKKKKHQFK